MKIIGVGICLFMVLGSAWLFRPYEKANYTMIDPRLKDIKEPCQSIIVDTYGDGGSMALKIIDDNGKIFEFCLPAPMNDSSYEYKKLFIGALYYTDSLASQATNQYHTKTRLAEILRADPNVDIGIDVFVYRLSGRWSDLWRYLRREHILKIYED